MYLHWGIMNYRSLNIIVLKATARSTTKLPITFATSVLNKMSNRRSVRNVRATHRFAATVLGEALEQVDVDRASTAHPTAADVDRDKRHLTDDHDPFLSSFRTQYCTSSFIDVQHSTVESAQPRDGMDSAIN